MFQLFLLDMASYAQMNGQGNDHERCGANDQNQKKDLNHHRTSGYQIALGVQRSTSQPDVRLRYTPTGNGLVLCSSARSRTRLSKRPWKTDIRPVYQ